MGEIIYSGRLSIFLYCPLLIAEEVIKFWREQLGVMAGSPNEDAEGSRVRNSH